MKRDSSSRFEIQDSVAVGDLFGGYSYRVKRNSKGGVTYSEGDVMVSGSVEFANGSDVEIAFGTVIMLAEKDEQAAKSPAFGLLLSLSTGYKKQIKKSQKEQKTLVLEGIKRLEEEHPEIIQALEKIQRQANGFKG